MTTTGARMVPSTGVLRVAVLECDVEQRLPRETQAAHGGDKWGQVAQHWLQNARTAGASSPPPPRFEFRHYQANVPPGVAPILPELRDFDVLLVPGAAPNVDDPLHWIAPCVDLVRRAFAARDKRVLGICFGHQLVAHALGGRQGPAPCGLNFTVDELALAPAAASLFGPGRRRLALYKSHGNQVLALPPGATALASSERTPHELYRIDRRVLCVQGHPEFSRAVMEHILATPWAAARVGDAQAVARILAEAEVDGDALRSAVLAFLREGDVGTDSDLRSRLACKM